MRRAQLWSALAIVVMAGCSSGESGLIPVTGTVKVDGQLTEGVQVSFWPADGKDSRNRYGAGMTGRDGRFELQSFSEKGIEAGEYKVTFTRTIADGKVITDPKKKADRTRQSLPGRYGDQETTEFTARVTKDNHDFVFDLSSKSK